MFEFRSRRQHIKEFEIIDTHIHLSRNLEEESGYLVVPGRRDRDRLATPEKIVGFMDRFGVLKAAFMVLIPGQFRVALFEKGEIKASLGKGSGALNKISQQIAPMIKKYNEWGCEIGNHYPRLLPFICISDDLGEPEAIVEEVVLRARQGAKGVKIHPGIFSLSPDNKVLWPMYAKCQELGLPIVADSGPWGQSLVLSANTLAFTKPLPAVAEYGEPRNFAPVLEAFPRLTLILAHLGSAWWDERVELAQRYPNVYFDTSQGFAAPDRFPVVPHRSLAEEDAVRIFRKIGVDRMMFGTDFPAIDPQQQLEQILRLPLTDTEKQDILANNARRILRI